MNTNFSAREFNCADLSRLNQMKADEGERPDEVNANHAPAAPKLDEDGNGFVSMPGHDPFMLKRTAASQI